MGRLIDGVWHNEDRVKKEDGGQFIRKESLFRDWITADGSSGFKAEPGRYHLYVCLACPWAHRTMIFRKLKKLEDAISVSVVDVLNLEEGWSFHGDMPGCIPDTANGADFLHQVYTKADPKITSKVTVPTLWDKRKQTVVNNESSEIIRMFNSEFNEFTDSDLDFYPEDLRTEIDAVNDRVLPTVNNGVYRTGFATSQEAYEESFTALFETLDWLEERLADQRYLVGDRITEADWRLFTTLVRFDVAYHGHFKCNRKRIVDYPNLWGYLRDLYQVPGVAETVNFDHIKAHYYGAQRSVNPTGIVAVGPDLDFMAPHGRGSL
jgi:glutathionyl-hydroquinone reductase